MDRLAVSKTRESTWNTRSRACVRLPVLFLLVRNHDPPALTNGCTVGGVAIARNFIARVHDHDGLRTDRNECRGTTERSDKMGMIGM